MTTVRDIIEQAHRLIRVVAGDEPMTADQAANGLFMFNAMMHGLELRGADVGHADSGLTDTSPLPNRMTEALVMLLASKLAPMFNRAFDGRQAERDIQAHYMDTMQVELPTFRTRWAGWRV